MDLALALCVSGAAIIAFCIANPEAALHWFIIPVFVSGVLIGPECFAWVRNRVDLFDAGGLVAAYGYYFFFVAPLLTVHLGYHSSELSTVSNWRDWIGLMAVLNCLGLVIYLGVKRSLEKGSQIARVAWFAKPGSFVHVMALVLPITAAFQLWIFAKFGGIWGFMQAFSSGESVFDGMGWQFLIAECFPTLLAAFVLVYKRNALRRLPFVSIILLAAAFFAAKLIFGGLRGSRSNTVWAVFWLCGAIHLWIKPVPRRLAVIGVVFLVLFMYAYGFYKAQGVDSLETLRSSDEMGSTGEKTGRTVDTALLGDLARSDIQAYLLYRLAYVRDYDYAVGGTYLGAVTLMLPKPARPSFAPTKSEKGTEALYGRRSFSEQYFLASQVYGLAGEAMLNFTPLAAPFSFAVLALLVAKTRTILHSHPDDCRRLLLPLLATLCIVVLTSDLDNVVMFLLTTTVPLMLILKFSSRRVAIVGS
jgi:hypothetical protein